MQADEIEKLSNEIFSEQVNDPDGICFECSGKKFIVQFKIIPSGKNCHTYYPQLRKICATCGKFKKFYKQSQKIIDEINQKIEGIWD